jgi:hypothetical protein
VRLDFRTSPNNSVGLMKKVAAGKSATGGQARLNDDKPT